MSLPPGEAAWNQGSTPDTEQSLAEQSAVLPHEASDESDAVGVEEAHLLPDSSLTPELTEGGVLPIRLSGLEQLTDAVRQAMELAGRYRIALLVGVTAVGIAADIVLDPNGLERDLGLPAAAWGIAEVAWIGGAVVSLAAVGKRLSANPLKVHKLFGELSDQSIAAAAKDNPLFWAGLTINTLAAIVQGVVPPAIIVLNSPPEGWSKSLIFLADLWITVIVRAGIYRAIRANEAEDSQ